MLTRMSDSPDSDPRAPTSAGGSGRELGGAGAEGPGVLAGLPRTRPQRASARRDASRAAKPSKVPAATRVAGQRKTTTKTATQTTNRRKPASVRRPLEQPVPRQGFEAEPDSLDGPVQPPGGTELVASAAELAGELAKSGITTGARLVRDFLSRLPG
jgi:hypothetical protein